MVTLQAVVTLLGRVLLAVPCLIMGIALIVYWENYTPILQEQGVPVVTLFMVIAIAFLILGGTSIALGWWARIGAVLAMIPVIAAIFTVSRFWDPSVQQNTPGLWGIWDNVAVVGGLIYVMTFGSGKISLDRRGQKH